MNLNKKISRAYAFFLLVGVLALGITLLFPSESESAFWLGYSRQRWIIFGAQFLLLLILAACYLLLRKNTQSPAVKKLASFLNSSEHYATLRYFLLGLAIFSSIAFFYLIVIIPQALAGFSGWVMFGCWQMYRLFIQLVKKAPAAAGENRPVRFTAWKQLPRQGKWIVVTLICIGVIYFAAFIPINLKGAESPREFYNTGGDEYVMYPVVVKMLSSQEGIRAALYRFFNYGDYIYGFPFYGLSALLLIPSKLIFGATWADHTQLNLLLLRQLVSVLPLIFSAFLVTYLATRFKHWWSSLPVFLLILTLPGVVHYNTGFWHPDSLNLLFITLVIFFLDRDKLRFGRNFYFAAVACGLSVATRLYGVFFFLAIAGLLIAGVVKKKISPRKALLHGLLFCVLMGATILATSPYLFNTGEYASLQRLSDKKQVDLFQGYTDADPEGVYKTGFKAWWPFLTQWYGDKITLAFLALSLLAGFSGRERKGFYWVLIAWLLVLGAFLIFFILVKSYQYMLPLLVPLYAAACALPEKVAEGREIAKKPQPMRAVFTVLVYTAIAVVGVHQLWLNLQWILAQHFFA